MKLEPCLCGDPECRQCFPRGECERCGGEGTISVSWGGDPGKIDDIPCPECGEEDYEEEDLRDGVDD